MDAQAHAQQPCLTPRPPETRALCRYGTNGRFGSSCTIHSPLFVSGTYR